MKRGFLLLMLVSTVILTASSCNPPDTELSAIDNLVEITAITMPSDVYLGDMIDSKVYIRNHRVAQTCTVYWDIIFRHQDTEAGTHFTSHASVYLNADGESSVNWTLPMQNETGYFECHIYTNTQSGDRNIERPDLKFLTVSIWPRDVVFYSVAEHIYHNIAVNTPSATVFTSIPSTFTPFTPIPTHQEITSATPTVTPIFTPASSTSLAPPLMPTPTPTTFTTTTTPPLTTIPTTAILPPMPNIAGTWLWNLEVTVANGACAGETRVQSPRNVQITQNGATVTMSGFLNSNPELTISGIVAFDQVSKWWIVNISGEYDEDQGRTSATYILTLNNSYDVMTGEESWSWSGGGGTCPGGKSVVTANKLP
jgi:hypothetical protein